jgi:hypothetical protein
MNKAQCNRKDLINLLLGGFDHWVQLKSVGFSNEKNIYMHAFTKNGTRWHRGGGFGREDD